ncbi:MAG TPA: RNA 2',3'-cyclic phosphodiesterase [Acidimicrobiia bacterium]
MRRLFLAVPLPEDVRFTLAQHLGPKALPGKPVPPMNWHLTLRFLGWTEPVTEEKLTAGLDQADLGRTFEIELGEMGAFPKPARATVLWLGLARGIEDLSALNLVCEEACQAVGLTPEDRPFSAHLTLSRIRPNQDVRPLIEAYQAAPFRWSAGELVLFESRLRRSGPVYTAVEHFPFR